MSRSLAKATASKRKTKREREELETAPELVVKPRRQFTDEGADAKFKCSFDGPRTTTLFWCKDGNVISPDRRYKIYESDGFHYLEVVEVVADDTGVYTVTVQNSAGSDDASAELEVFVKPKLLSKPGPEWEQQLTDIAVQVGDVGVTSTCIAKGEKEKMEPPVFLTDLQDLEVEEGDRMVLGVEVKGSQPMEVLWFHNNVAVTPDSGLFLQTSLGRVHILTVPRVIAECSGEYVCEAYNEWGDADTFCLVDVKEVERPEAPDFLTHTITRNVHEGQSVTFKCQVKGHPLPSVSWERNGVTLSSGEKYKMTQIKDQHTLTIGFADHSDVGEYICRLRNIVGEKSAVCVLKVKAESTQQTVGDLKSRLSRLSEMHSRPEPRHTNHVSKSVLSFSAAQKEETNSDLGEDRDTAKPSHSKNFSVPLQPVHKSHTLSQGDKTFTSAAKIKAGSHPLHPQETSTSRRSYVTKQSSETVTDFRSVLLKPKNSQETKLKTVAEKQLAEVETDFRNVLKPKEKSDDSDKSFHSVTNAGDSDVKKLILKVKDQRLENFSTVDKDQMKSTYKISKCNLPEESIKPNSTWKHSDEQQIHDVEGKSVIDKSCSTNSEHFSTTYLLSIKQDTHLDLSSEAQLSPQEMDFNNRIDADLSTEPSPILHDQEAETNGAGQYTAVPVEFTEPSTKPGLAADTAVVDTNRSNATERVFHVTIAHPVKFVQSPELTAIPLGPEPQSKVTQQEPAELNKVISYLQFTPKSESKSLSGTDFSPRCAHQELPSSESLVDDLNDDVFGSLDLTQNRMSIYDDEKSRYSDQQVVNQDTELQVTMRNKKLDKNTAQVRFARTSEDLSRYSSEERSSFSQKTANGMKSSSKSTSSYEDQGKPEFQRVQLKPATTKPPNSGDLRSSKNLSKSTEALFKVKLKHVSPANDSSATWKQSQATSDLQSAKAKSKSQFDLSDKGLYQRTLRDQGSLPKSPWTASTTTSSTNRTSKIITGNAKAPGQQKEWPVSKRARNVNTVSKPIPASNDKPSVARSEYISPDLSKEKKLNDKVTLTNIATQVKKKEKKMLGEIGKSLSNSDILRKQEEVVAPAGYGQRYESKRSSLQHDSPPAKLDFQPKFNADALRDSKSLSKSMGKLDSSPAYKVSSKRELFETLEQANKPDWRKKADDRTLNRSRIKVTTKIEPNHPETRPEWMRKTTHCNIDEKIKAIKKEKMETTTFVAPWVKTDSVNKEKLKVVDKFDEKYRTAGFSEATQLKEKTLPLVAPKPAKRFAGEHEGNKLNGIADESHITEDILKDSRTKSNRQRGQDLAPNVVLGQGSQIQKQKLAGPDLIYDVDSMSSCCQEVLRSSTEDLDSVISVSSSSSEVSTAASGFSHSHDDPGLRLSTGDKPSALRRNEIKPHRERSPLSLEATSVGQESFQPDHVRSSKRGSLEDIVEQTAENLHGDRGGHAARLGSTSSQDSGLILDMSNPRVNTPDMVLADTAADPAPEKMAPGTSFDLSDREEISPALILKVRRERRSANKAAEKVSEIATQDTNINGGVSKEQDHSIAYDRAKEFRSKFKDRKNWERMEVTSSDTLLESISNDRSSPANNLEEGTVQSRLKDRLKDISSQGPKSNAREGRAAGAETGDLPSALPEGVKAKMATSDASQGEVEQNDAHEPVVDLVDRVWKPVVKGGHNIHSPESKGHVATKVNPEFMDKVTAVRLSKPQQADSGGQGSQAPSGQFTASVTSKHQQGPPNFLSLLKNLTVMYGCRASLHCSVVGDPAPDIKWLHNFTPIEPCKNIEVTYRENVARLTVLETFSEHVGEYTCWAKNHHGSLSTHCTLELEASNKEESRIFEGPVSVGPRILSLEPKNALAVKGSALTFTLTYEGEPAPRVKWMLNGEELIPDEGAQIMTEYNTSTLTIQPVSQSHVGSLCVCVDSSIGSDQLVTSISIEDVPGPPEGKPHVYEISKHSASVSWSPPSFIGGSPVTYYTVEAKTRQQTVWDVLVQQCKDLNCHIQDLTPSSTYQFRVRASNKHGLGPPSEPSDRVITTDTYSDDDGEGYPEVFTPTVEYRTADDFPFEPRDVTLNHQFKFQELYELENEVGKGKFGIVYRCKQKSDGKTFAAKILKVKEKAMIQHEIEIMNCLRHPKLLLLWDAFEEARRIVLVMEFIGAGELFERVIREDFILTERDCVHFLRQICEGVSYMHSLNILHLDLKPENILCVAENSNRIKIIDFGLARKYDPKESVKVLNGTPEFIAPEVINYDAISYHTDMWSVGVICYVLLSGLSPFAGDDENETLSNVTSGEFDFDDEAFDQISEEAKDFITRLLVKKKEDRMLTSDCLDHTWLSQDEVDGGRYNRLNTERLKKYLVRRKWLKTGKAVLAVGRLQKTASLSNLFRSGSNDSLLSSIAQMTPVTDSCSSTNSVEEDRVSSSSRDDLSSEHCPVNDDECVAVDGHLTVKPAGQGAIELETEVIDGRTREKTTDLNENHVTGNADIQRDINLSTKPKFPREDNYVSSKAVPTTSTRDNAVSQTKQRGILNQPHIGGTTDCLSSAPEFIKPMKRSKTCTGDAARFDVTVSACPDLVVTWYFEDEEICQDERHALSANTNSGSYSLIIRGIREEDEGDYSCKAVNPQGEVTCSAELSVLDF